VGVMRLFDFELNWWLNVSTLNLRGISDVPNPDKPTRDRAALQRLLRRRGRRGKAGANPDTETRLHAWHSSYSFRPASDHSPLTRALSILGVLIVLASPALIALIWAIYEPFEHWSSPSSLIFHAAVYGCMILIIATIIIAPVLMIALSLGGAWESWRERRMPTGDGARTAAGDTAVQQDANPV